jgi:uncharacterized membrane protein YdbT with pleckstrin-like domain
MSYVRRVLQPGETVLALGEYHWIIYLRSIWFVAAGVIAHMLMTPIAAASAAGNSAKVLPGLVFAGFMILAAISFFRAWFLKWTTELAITNRRVIFKAGFIRRRTAEMNMDKVETVNVDQSVLFRFLDYGTIHIRGTGTGIEHLHQIAHPLELRSAVTAK